MKEARGSIIGSLIALILASFFQDASADFENVVWLRGAGTVPNVLPSNQFDAADCEVYIDQFFETHQNFRGTSTTRLGMVVRAREPQNVERVGLLALVHEKSSVLSINALPIEKEQRHLVGAVSESSFDNLGSFDLEIETQWSKHASASGSRSIQSFIIFIDIKRDGTLLRFWLDNVDRDFEPTDFDPRLVRYSKPESYGYGSRAFLSRDTGSAIFNARNQCLK